MELSPEITQKIQELQLLEQNLQGLLMQRQTHQVELNEILNALDELSKSGEEVYRILGGIMVKSDKKTLSADLKEKEKVLNLRIQSIEKQEKSIEDKSHSLQEEIQKFIGKKQNSPR